MPEGPTIRNTADTRHEALAGRRVEHVHRLLKTATSEAWASKIAGGQVLTDICHSDNQRWSPVVVRLILSLRR